MNWTLISRNVGMALLASALFMLLSLVYSVVDGVDSSFGPLLVSFLITALVGSFPFIFVKKGGSPNLKEGFVVIVLSWLLSFIFGMLPYVLWGGPFSVSNAWFESVSGYTTTGATILDDIEALPRSLLFWRSSTHFIGGLGVVVLLQLIIPNASPVKLKLTNIELDSMSRGYYSTRSNKNISIFEKVYLGIAVAAFFCYWACGMNAFDALNHAMSVCATGGFSTHNLSIGYFDSRWIELVSIIFMILSSLHFGVIYMSVIGRSIKPFNNPIVKFYLLSMLLIALMVSFNLRFTGFFDSWGESFWESLFQTVSITSTTGFAILDNADWPMFSNMLLLVMGIICGCAGSTTGGLKVDRVMVMFKSVDFNLKKILRPTSVNEIRLGGRIVKDEEVAAHLRYIALYFFVLAISIVLSLACGVSEHNALAASVSCLGNVGPGIRELGTMGSFNCVSNMAKYVFTLDMFLGRVEIFPVLTIFSLIIDSRRK